MPTYVLLSTLTPEGRQTLHKNPGRLEEVNREIEAFGCKLLAQYALLGPYDFVSVIEAPDNETVAHLSVDLGSRGTVNIMTLPAIPREQFLAKLKGQPQMGKN
ncbi:MAG: GYD domain-containing protein [Candidatus Tectimicrobiota bacterium]|nr:MAG: GYD domain-containing protein [Candidatus Tectomicrobia bacterium]